MTTRRSTSTISKTFDLNKMTKSLITGVNARLGGPVVTDIGIQEFTFLTVAQAKAMR